MLSVNGAVRVLNHAAPFFYSVCQKYVPIELYQLAEIGAPFMRKVHLENIFNNRCKRFAETCQKLNLRKLKKYG